MKRRIFGLMMCVVLICMSIPVNAYASSDDTEKPVISGIENDGMYCKSVRFTVTDNVGVASVRVMDTEITADSDGYYTWVNEGYANYLPVTVVATDIAGNVSSMIITVNSFHVMSSWASDETHFWLTCENCGWTDGTKHQLPEVVFDGPDKICRSDKYVYTVKIPDGFEIGECSGINITKQEDGSYLCEERFYNHMENIDSITLWMEIFNEEYINFLYRATKTVAVGHTALTHIEAKEATAAGEGNIEYWYCKDCDRYYSDEEGRMEITKAQTVIALKAPTITEGAGQKVTAGKNTDLIFRSDAGFNDFVRVEIDGVTLEQSNYTAVAGSIVVTLKGEYVASLSEGVHTIGIVSEGGNAETEFTVVTTGMQEAPATGDTSDLLGTLVVLAISGGCVLLALYDRKRFRDNMNKR